MPLFGADYDSDASSIASSHESSYLPEPSFDYKRKPLPARSISPVSDGPEDDANVSEDLPPVEQLDQDSETESDVQSERSSPSVEMPLPVQTNLYARKTLAELSRQDPSRNRVMQASIFQPSRKTLHLPPKPKLALSKTTSPPRELPSMDLDQPRELPPRMPGPIQRKHRKLTKTPSAKTVVPEATASNAIAAIGRSYRSGWAPDGKIASWGNLCQNRTDLSKVCLETPALVASTSAAAAQAADATLHIQFKHSHIDVDQDGIPFSRPASTLRFHHFQTTFDQRDTSFEASLFRLASALYDEIPDLDTSSLSQTQAAQITALARQATVSAWLKRVTAPSAENDLRTHNDPAHQIFAYLTAHQIEEACSAAVAAKDLRLATLLAQASHPDEAFQADLKLQLSKWREQQADPHIPRPYRRIYELLSGNVGLSPASTIRDEVDGAKAVYVPEGLDWKRAFACGYWYAGSSAADPLRAAVEGYQSALQGPPGERPASPAPWYATSSANLKRWHLADPSSDALFELLRFASSPTASSLEDVLAPTGFSPSPLDVRLPWHLYQVLARVLRVADFEDRGEEATSAKAEQLTAEYAHQLERLGLWEWACFVLLHLEYPESRAKGIKEVITNNVAALTDEAARRLTDDFAIPSAWIDECQALHARFYQDSWTECRLLLSAGLHSNAHRIIVWDLAPEAVVRSDFELLESLFAELKEVEVQVADWQSGGQVYLDYVACVIRLPDLLRRPQHDPFELNRLSQHVLPDLLARLPGFLTDKSGQGRGLLRQAAVSEMLARLSQIKIAFGTAAGALDFDTPLDNLATSDRIAWLGGLTMNLLEEGLVPGA